LISGLVEAQPKIIKNIENKKARIKLLCFIIVHPLRKNYCTTTQITRCCHSGATYRKVPPDVMRSKRRRAATRWQQSGGFVCSALIFNSFYP